MTQGLSVNIDILPEVVFFQFLPDRHLENKIMQFCISDRVHVGSEQIMWPAVGKFPSQKRTNRTQSPPPRCKNLVLYYISIFMDGSYGKIVEDY